MVGFRIEVVLMVGVVKNVCIMLKCGLCVVFMVNVKIENGYFVKVIGWLCIFCINSYIVKKVKVYCDVGFSVMFRRLNGVEGVRIFFLYY